MFIELNNGGAHLDRLNYSFIILIPKRDSPESITEYRPIALLNNMLKIFSKVLASCLSSFLQKIIGDTLTSFIAGCNNIDGVTIAQEVVYQCRKSGEDGYLLKLDFEKAYDKMDWNQVLEIMRN